MIEEVIMPPKSHKSEEEGIDMGIINSVLLRIGVTGTRSRDNINALFGTTVYCSVVYIYVSYTIEAKKLDCAECICIIGRDKHQRVHAELKFIVIYGGGPGEASPPFPHVNVSLIKCGRGNEAI